MSKKEFLEFSRTTFRDMGLVTDLETWYDKCLLAHEVTTKKIGGMYSIKKIEIGSDEESKIAKWQDVEAFARSLVDLIPAYFPMYSLGAIDMCQQKVPKIGQRWGSHIKFWMEKNKIDPAIQKKVEQNISFLGEVWAKAKLDKEYIHIGLSTDPRVFASIGHLGNDLTSCFKHGSTNEVHKFIFGQTPGTFVLFVGLEELKFDKIDEIGPYSCRVLGMFDETYTKLLLTNRYKRPYGSMDDKKITDALDGLAHELLGLDEILKAPTAGKFNGIWQNKDGILYMPEGSEKPKTHILFNMDSTGLDQYRRCFKCQAICSDLVKDDREYQYCPKCAAVGHIDFITGRLFFGNSYIVYVSETRTAVVSTNTCVTHCGLCNLTQRYYLNELLVKTAGPDHIYYMNKFDALYCETCKSYCLNNKCRCGCDTNRKKYLVEAQC